MEMMTHPNEKNLVSLLENLIKSTPNKIAATFLIDGESKEVSLTYERLGKQAKSIAIALKRMGIKSQSPILLVYEPGLDFIAAFFGCLYAGVIAIPVYFPHNKETASTLQHIINNASPQLCLTTRQLSKKLRGLKLINNFSQNSLLRHISTKILKNNIINYSDHVANSKLNNLAFLSTDDLAENLSSEWTHCLTKSHDIAFLQYTSGSTSRPKGVMVTHDNLFNNLLKISEVCDTKTLGTIVSWLPQYHDMGLIGTILAPICLNVHTVLLSPLAFLQRPIRWLQAISQYRAGMSTAPNFAYDLCVKTATTEEKAALNLSNWRFSISGAEPIRAKTIERFLEAFSASGLKHQIIAPCYGLAESTLIASATYSGKTNLLHFLNHPDTQQSIVSCGFPLEEIIIVNPDTKAPCSEQEIGEIWLRGPSIAKGYWQDTQLTQEIFKAYVNDGRGPYLRSGDLGCLWQGELYITGRLKDVIIIQGRNYYPQDFEFTSEESDPNLRKGCCAAFSGNNDQDIILAQEIKINAAPTYANIAQKIRQAILKIYGIALTEILLIKPKTLPKTTSGKIRRSQCRELYLTNQLEVIYQDKALNKNPDAAFLLLTTKTGDKTVLLSQFGLTSLNLVDLTLRIENHFGVTVPISFLLTDPTIEQLEQFIQKEGISPKKIIDWEKELDTFPVHLNTNKHQPTLAQSILLTGATGLVGAYLIKEVLETSSCLIFCLVRATSCEDAWQKIIANMRFYHLWRDEYREHLKMVLGDLTKPQLGLNQSDYSALSRTIDTIYHNGAALNFVYTYEYLKPTNILGTHEILLFANHTKLKSIHYISTLGYFLSADLPQNFIINENFDLSPDQGLYGGYNQSKWLAEKIMKKAILNGFPINIYRLGLIIGDEKMAILSADNFVSRMIKGFIQLSMIPNRETELDLTPVDYAARAIILLSKQKSFGKTFHLTNPTAYPYQKLLEFFCDYHLTMTDYTTWKSQLISQCRKNAHHPLYPLLPFFVEKIPDKHVSMFELYTRSDKAKICNQITQHALQTLGFSQEIKNLTVNL